MASQAGTELCPETAPGYWKLFLLLVVQRTSVAGWLYIIFSLLPAWWQSYWALLKGHFHCSRQKSYWSQVSTGTTYNSNVQNMVAKFYALSLSKGYIHCLWHKIPIMHTNQLVLAWKTYASSVHNSRVAKTWNVVTARHHHLLKTCVGGSLMMVEDVWGLAQQNSGVDSGRQIPPSLHHCIWKYARPYNTKPSTVIT